MMVDLTFIYAAAVLAGTYFAASLLWPMLAGGAGYSTTPGNAIAEALDLCRMSREETFYDLGCRTGEVLIEVSKICDHVKGIEIEPIRWLISRIRAGKRARVILGNFFKQDISDADVVFIFQYKGEINSRIAEKIKRGTRRGTRVVSYMHPVENMKLMRRQEEIFVYEVE
jgi:precorrin-6B methylase 2